MAAKQRLDKLMFERGLAPSREKAQALIMAGQVIVDDHVVDKAGQQVAVEADIRIRGEVLPYVSRGGLKLKKALDEFKVDVTGLVALDVGASTGGFTDCLLQAGAAKVFAVDVGYGQLAWKLQQDPRVVSMERVNIRYLEQKQLGGEPELAVIDPFAHEMAIEGVRQTARDLGLTVSGQCDSPITGADGNREFLILLDLPEHAEKEADVDNCLFCKIIRGEIPSKKVHEDEQLLVIEDVSPKAPLHLLLIPKRHFVNCLDMGLQDDALVGSLFRKAADIARQKGYDASGFRIVQNNGAGAGQSVFHIHFHLLAGREFAWPPG